MTKWNLVWVGMMLGCSALSWAQSGPSLYTAGYSIKDQGISLRPWGSGTIAETDEMAFQGDKSIRVTFRNFFQGGSLLLAKPVDFSGAYNDKNNLLLLTFRYPEDKAASTGGGAVGGKGGAGGTLGGLSGGGGTSSSSSIEIPPLQTIRLVFTTSDGKRAEAYLKVAYSQPDKTGWRKIGIPLQAITGLGGTNKIIQEVAFSGDAPTRFFIGEISTLNDRTELRAEPTSREDRNIGLTDELTFSAYGEGGASIVKFTWRFKEMTEDGRPMGEVEIEGQTIRRRFRRPGKYVVTVTISDIYGLKAPFTSAPYTIVVNP